MFAIKQAYIYNHHYEDIHINVVAQFKMVYLHPEICYFFGATGEFYTHHECLYYMRSA